MQNEVPFICNKRLVKVQEPVDADGTYLLNHVQPVRALDPSVCSCGPRGTARPAAPSVSGPAGGSGKHGCRRKHFSDQTYLG